MQAKYKPYFILFTGVLCVSLAAPFIRLTTAPSVITAFYRLLITFLLLAPLSCAKEFQDFKRLQFSHVLLSILSGLALAAHFVFWISSVHYTSVASSTVLVNIHPLIVVLFSYILWREIPHLQAWAGVVLALCGVLLLGWHDLQVGEEKVLGDVLALAGAAAVAIYYLLGRSLRQDLSLGVYTSLVYGASTISLLMYVLLRGYPLYPYSRLDWLAFAGLALVSTILGHTSLNWSLKYLPATTVSTSVLGEPALASLIAWVFLAEPLSTRHIIAVLSILTGLAWFIYQQKSDK